ncbi:hypothetical protein P4388_33745 [Bacillus thuringiensis]|uniref:Uncharacterized protein n=4 Tax=root TaxID=1 RepID=Q5ILC9_9VIRU|nr:MULTISPECIES: hypothetical protein [Bacillales]YP_224101.1 hypothetical protein GIL16c_gp03 [Bacillus phage GIL16c]AAW33567.1 hypothetical protein [Bacillus phage GIL16c]AIE37877.1 putative cytoplasmic protein [Bacillus thuringiensis serovar kurstaki str. HD-1]AJK44548.1 hypothetical protein BG08_7038 [Bacillus thuringiensis serovar kurstaki]EOP13602.1 hypothetical protein IGG_06837 [Bacillus cereus HuB13-1]EOP50256.1 hypothetical protein IGU_06837 [Bacillus cereus ISP2954]
MNAIKNLVQVSIRTNERELEFVSFNGMVHLKQKLEEDETSVVLTKEELDMVAAMSNFDNVIANFMNSITEKKAM